MTAQTSTLTAGFALASILAITISPASAQEGDTELEAESGTLEEIVVEAPWLTEREIVGRSAVGAPIEEVRLTRRIDYSDLDLTKTADVRELESRIDSTAREMCDKLEQMYPLDRPDTPDCVNQALEDAMAQADRVVAAASGAEQDVATAPEEERQGESRR